MSVEYTLQNGFGFQGAANDGFSLVAGPDVPEDFFRGSPKMSWWDRVLNATIGRLWDRCKTKQVTIRSQDGVETFFMRMPEVKRLEVTIPLLQRLWNQTHPAHTVAGRPSLPLLPHPSRPPPPSRPLPPLPHPVLAVAGRLPASSGKIANEKEQQAEELAIFERLEGQGRWQDIHERHYDWWMFPINKVSRGHGELFAFSKEELDALRSDPAFLDSYRKGVRLQARAWGWDIDTKAPVPNPGRNQAWTGYGIRLAKMADSLWLMGEREMFASMQQFAKEKVLPGKVSNEPLVIAALHMKVEGEGLVPNPSPDLTYHEPKRFGNG